MISHTTYAAKLERIQELFEIAMTRFEQGRSALYGKDGKLLYSVQEHNRRWRDLAKNLREAAANAHKEIEGVNTAIDKILKGSNVNPLTQLADSAAIRERNDNHDIIETIVTNYTVADLAREVEGIAIVGSPVKRSLYTLFVRMRLSKEKEKYMRTGVQDPQLELLEDALSQLTANDPDPKEDMKIAKQISDEGGKLGVRINSRLYDLVGNVEGEPSWVQRTF
jgi:hypothetical protein